MSLLQSVVPYLKPLLYYGLVAAFAVRLSLGLYTGRFGSMDLAERKFWVVKQDTPKRFWLCALVTVAAGAFWAWFGWKIGFMGGHFSN